MIDVIFGEESRSLDATDASGFENWSAYLKQNPYPKAPVLGFRSGDQTFDLQMKIPATGSFTAILAESDESLELVRHSCAHIMAQAVKRLYPETQVTIGPVIENGFYYDFSRAGGFKEEDFAPIEAEMKKIVKERYPLIREEWPKDKALEHFKKQGELYKMELINDICRDQNTDTVSVYIQGDWLDLCRGAHVPHTGWVKSFKLMKLAGAYWRGDEKNEMLTRIYGTAFATKESLQAHLHQIEEAKKRDHRRIGTDQGLFSFHSEAPASPFFHPNGAFLFAKLQEYLAELNRVNGFDVVITPLVMNNEMWKKSGHYANYSENMYFTKVDELDFAIKPMNCPGHCLIYGTDKHSYRDLPIRYAEFGRVHRHERSGVVNGLFRVRSFVQDDAHIFCTTAQIESEILRVLKMIRHFYQTFGFTYHVELSTRPEKRIGAEEVWDKAEAALAEALKGADQAYKVNPGDGAFYGPKIDFHLKDSIGRTHQCGTIQLDFSMPERFGLKYTGSDNVEHIPVMIHRAIAGSLERFIGILIEHYAGKFPVWMMPKQVAVMCIQAESAAYAREVHELVLKKGYRSVLDDTDDNINSKIKAFQKHQVPYMIVVGAKEMESQTISIRTREGTKSFGVPLDSFFDQLAAQPQPQLS
jgi:threonyl-tRNA synthetase